MKIILDARKCPYWTGVCQVCFRWHYLGEEIVPNYCIVEMWDDGQQERGFTIIDGNNARKEFSVSEEKRGETVESWPRYWEQLLNGDLG